MTGTSAAQISANRANAQLSTGPKTPEGKAKMAANPLRHGLTSAHLIIPGEKESDFLALLAGLTKDYAPVGNIELELVQQIVEQEWRLIRIARVENATLTMYIREYLEESAGSEVLAHALTYGRHGKEFDRILRYETTTRRLRNRLVDELARIQNARYEAEALARVAAQRQARREAGEAARCATLNIQSQPVMQNGSVSQNVTELGVTGHEQTLKGVSIARSNESE